MVLEAEASAGTDGNIYSGAKVQLIADTKLNADGSNDFTGSSLNIVKDTTNTIQWKNTSNVVGCAEIHTSGYHTLRTYGDRNNSLSADGVDGIKSAGIIYNTNNFALNGLDHTLTKSNPLMTMNNTDTGNTTLVIQRNGVEESKIGREGGALLVGNNGNGNLELFTNTDVQNNGLSIGVGDVSLVNVDINLTGHKVWNGKAELTNCVIADNVGPYALAVAIGDVIFEEDCTINNKLTVNGVDGSDGVLIPSGNVKIGNLLYSGQLPETPQSGTSTPYTVSQSSFADPSFLAWRIMSLDFAIPLTSSNQWASSSGAHYNTTTGDYQGGQDTVTTNAGTITGEWISIDFGTTSILPNSFTIRPDKWTFPKTFCLIGKVDGGVDWELISTHEHTNWTTTNSDGVATGAGSRHTSDRVTFVTGATKKYRYFRFVIRTIRPAPANNGYARLQYFTINGIKGTLSNIDSTGNLTLTGNASVSNNLTVGSDFIYHNPYFECYCDTNANITNIATVNVPVLVNFGTNILAPMLQDFIVTTAGRITYTGARSRMVHAGATITCKSGTNNESLEFRIYRNGVYQAGSRVIVKTASSTEYSSTAIHTMGGHFHAGDYLELYCANLSSTASITVEAVNIFGMTMPNDMTH